ncbi:hypothetical protein ABZ656_38095 [Streptomyces sp. NPDC007095]
MVYAVLTAGTFDLVAEVVCPHPPDLPVAPVSPVASTAIPEQ